MDQSIDRSIRLVIGIFKVIRQIVKSSVNVDGGNNIIRHIGPIFPVSS